MMSMYIISGSPRRTKPEEKMEEEELLGLGERERDQGIEIVSVAIHRRNEACKPLFDPPSFEIPSFDHASDSACKEDSTLPLRAKESAKEMFLWQHETPDCA